MQAQKSTILRFWKKGICVDNFKAIYRILSTLKGLEYLQENSIMRKMYNAAKGIADVLA